MILQLNKVSNKVSLMGYFWLKNIPRGYITKIAVDRTQSHNVAERDF
jgi:hypothetical protein